jgi:hypothetical protein
MFRRGLRTKPQVLSFYRKSIKIINQLEFNYQKVWYDYCRLKFKENELLKDDKKIKIILEEAHEELDWIQTIIDSKSMKKISNINKK